MKLKHTVPCSRPGVAAEYDEFGNLLAAAIPEVVFEAAFAPPTTQSGSQIIDGILRETTVTKPTLYVEGRPDVHSGDPIIVDGDAGWEVDGDPALFVNAFSGRQAPLVIELRKSAG